MIIEANDTHISEIVQLVNTAYRSKAFKSWTSESEIVSGDRVNEDQIKQLLKQSKLFVMLDETKIIGCVHILIQDRSCYVGMLTTHPELQNKGIGKQILEFVEEYAKFNYVFDYFKISVLSARTELIHFYQRRGYQLTGDIYPYPIDANIGKPISQELSVLYLQKNIL